MLFIVHQVETPVSEHLFMVISLFNSFKVVNHKKKDFILLYRRVMIPKKELAEVMEVGKRDKIAPF
jgi:argonaute-like protein implicated in RNA metabolism and viral defense